jgi:hypothetical protein
MSTLHGSDDDIDLTGDFARETRNDSAHPESLARIYADTAGISADSAHESAMAALKAASVASATRNTVFWFVVGIIAGLVMALVMIVLVDTIVTAVSHPVAESPMVAVELVGTLRG